MLSMLLMILVIVIWVSRLAWTAIWQSECYVLMLYVWHSANSARIMHEAIIRERISADRSRGFIEVLGDQSALEWWLWQLCGDFWQDFCGLDLGHKEGSKQRRISLKSNWALLGVVFMCFFLASASKCRALLYASVYLALSWFACSRLCLITRWVALYIYSGCLTSIGWRHTA